MDYISIFEVKLFTQLEIRELKQGGVYRGKQSFG